MRAGSHELDDYVGESVKRIFSDTLRPFFNMTYGLGKGFSWDSRNEVSLIRRRFDYVGLDGATPAFNNLVKAVVEAATC